MKVQLKLFYRSKKLMANFTAIMENRYNTSEFIATSFNSASCNSDPTFVRPFQKLYFKEILHFPSNKVRDITEC